MAKLNGNLWRIIGWATGVIVVLAGAFGAYKEMGSQVKTNCDQISEIKPAVAANSEHRLRDEADTENIKGHLTEIKATQRQILQELRAR